MIRPLLFLLFLTKNLCALENIDFIVVNKEKRDIIVFKEGISSKYSHPTSGDQNNIEYSKGETTEGEAML